MKIMIASDIHGSAFYCEKLLEAYKREGAERLLILGDILYHGPRNDLPKEYNPKAVITMLNSMKEDLLCVRGNCDMYTSLPTIDIRTVCDKKIMATHGYEQNVKFGLYDLQLDAVSNKCDIVLFGHTHTPLSLYKDGIYYFNPGSVYDGCYAEKAQNQVQIQAV